MNEKPENSLGEESAIRQDQDSKNEDVMTSEIRVEINPVDLQKQTEEFPEANPTDEAASVKLGVDAAESSVDEGVQSSQVPMSNEVDEKNNEVVEKIETSIDEEGSEPIVMGKDSELSSLLDNDSAARATDSVQTEDHETFRSELAELPQGVLNDLYAAESTNYPAVEANSSEADQSAAAELPVGVLDNPVAAEETNHPAVEADSSSAEQPQQLEEASTGSSIVDEENRQTTETCEESKAGNSSEADQSGAAELPVGVLDNPVAAEETNHPAVEADSSSAEQPQQLEEASTWSSIVDEENRQTTETREESKAGIMEESKASDERELPTTGEDVPTNDEPHGNTGITDTATEEPPTTETKMSAKLRAAEDTNHPAVEADSSNGDQPQPLEEASTESSTVEESQNVDGENQQTMETHEDIKPGLMEENITTNDAAAAIISSDATPDICIVEQDEPPKGGVEKQESEDRAGHDEEESNGIRDETKEKLIEEKERLREMVEKLIKSGQDQLTAISTLSGRVKELEKRLSRKKKKLKVKQFRPPKSFDSYGEIGVAM